MYVGMRASSWLSSKESAFYARAAGDSCSIPGLGRSLVGGHAHSSILAWRIPGTEEPGGLQFMGCKESDMTEAT